MLQSLFRKFRVRNTLYLQQQRHARVDSCRAEEAQGGEEVLREGCEEVLREGCTHSPHGTSRCGMLLWFNLAASPRTV